jgi:uroporphyrinogen-III synthase
VLIVQGDLAPPLLAEGINRLGWHVDRVIGYRTVEIAPDPGLVEAALAADVVTFASGSAVRSFVQHLGLGAMPPIVVTLGHTTRKIAQELGVAVTASADSNTLTDLGLAVVAACRRTSTGQNDNEAPRD